MLLSNKKGVTIVELIIVIVIMAVISTFAVYGVTRALENSKQKGDEVVLSNINEATNMLLYHNELTSSSEFYTLESDEERLQYLVDEGLLSSYPEPQIDTNTYVYDTDLKTWTLNGSDGNKIYTETSSEYFTVSGSKITNYDSSGGKDIVIPKEINGVAITEIGQGAFQSKGLTSVVIQDNIIRISGNAFHSNNLTSISIPSSVERIWHNAFYGNKLTSVVFHEGLQRIEAGAFSDNDITEISFPSSLTYIGSGAFGYGGNFIEKITIGNNVTIDNNTSLGWYGSAFISAYDPEKLKGTYIYSSGTFNK